MLADLSDNVLGGAVDRCLEDDVRLIGGHVVDTDKKHVRVEVGTDVRKQ